MLRFLNGSKIEIPQLVKSVKVTIFTLPLFGESLFTKFAQFAQYLETVQTKTSSDFTLFLPNLQPSSTS